MSAVPASALTGVAVAVVTAVAAPPGVVTVAAVRWAARPPAARRLTRMASSLYCGSRSLRSASTGVAMKIEE